MELIREVPDSLSRAQLSLDGIENITILETLRWYEQAKKWAIRFRISLPKLDIDCHLNTSDWYLTVDEIYPFGYINVYPAKQNGIVETYPHQTYNSEGEPNLPWRSGNICTNTQIKVVGRHGYDVEPYTTNDRLLWHCKRSIEWVSCARKGELVSSDAPFELPQVPPSCEALETIRFSEGEFNFSPWLATGVSTGSTRCFNLISNENSWFIEILMGPKNEELFQVSWGQHITDFKGKNWDGIWLRVPNLPIVKPYRFPETWGELKQVLSEQGISLKNILRLATRHLHDGKTHFILIGFPIPSSYGGPPEVMHWLAIVLPILSHGNEYLDGFRANDQGYFENDLRTRFCSNKRLIYMPTENWHSEQIHNRGRFQDGLSSSRVAVIGCGALGAPIAEMLVRGGVNHMTLIDGEQIEIGNLTRHTLSLNDVGKEKAAQLAKRLNSLNPHARVEHILSNINLGNREILSQIQKHDLIVDCTGSDETLYALADISFSHAMHLFSLSVGFRAQKMFFFHAKKTSFPIDDYRAKIRVWLEAEQDEFKGETFPRDGIGCYHPVFPARCDDMWLWSSIAIKGIAKAFDSDLASSIFHVYEQSEETDGSVSIRRVVGATAYG